MEALLALLALVALAGVFAFGFSRALDNPSEPFVIVDAAGVRHERVEAFTELPAPFSGVCRCGTRACPLKQD